VLTGQKLLRRVAVAITLGIAAGFVALPKETLADESKQTPHEIKALALLDIARYVEWPEGAFLLTNSPVMLGVYGNVPLVQELKKQAATRRVNGRRVIVRQYFWPMTPNCQVLFIAATETARTKNILQKVQYARVLTVSDMADFTRQGGMVHFGLGDQKVNFSINLGAVTNANLKVSARLLSVANLGP
jgi:hypothetical protein